MGSDPIGLSLCAIVRDEEASLPRLLASVAGLVDEIVVTDTGSTDNSVEIAERAGAVVRRFTWCDDFSAAYNHSLDHATGEWILLLDADEELAPGSHDEIRRLIRREEAFAYTMLRQDYYGDEVREDAYSEMLQTRLFRRRDSVRFVGRIHQQLEPRLTRCAESEERRTFASNVRLLHYGYMGDYRGRKMDRTIHLLQLELEERPDSFYYLVELGRAKVLSGDASGSVELRRAAEHVVSGKQRIHSSCASLEMLLEQLLCCERLPDDFPLSIPRVEQIANETFPTSIPLLWRRALLRYKSGDYSGSAGLLEELLALADRDAYSRLVSFPPNIMGADAVLNLGVCYARMARFKEAKDCFSRLADHPRHGPAARENLAAIRKMRNS